MNNNDQSTDNKLRDLFKEMPLEEPSLNFTENLICRIEKESIKQKRKKIVLNLLPIAVSILSLLCLPGLVIYLCTIYIPGFSFSITIPEIRFDPTILSIGITVLFLLVSDTLLRKYIRNKKK
jgi:hypothetical protein